MNKRIDLAIFISEGYQNADETIISNIPVLDKRVQIDDDLWIGDIDKEMGNKFSEQIFSELAPKCWADSTPQFYQLYSIVRELKSLDNNSEWDKDIKIQTLIALSRLIHPTSFSLNYSATVEYNEKKEIVKINMNGDVHSK